MQRRIFAINEAVPFKDAESVCGKHRGTLARPQSSTEVSKLKNFSARLYVWIAMRKAVKFISYKVELCEVPTNVENQWQRLAWRDGGHPTVHFQKNMKFTSFSCSDACYVIRYLVGSLDDWSCDKREHVLCERSKLQKDIKPHEEEKGKSLKNLRLLLLVLTYSLVQLFRIIIIMEEFYLIFRFPGTKRTLMVSSANTCA